MRINPEMIMTTVVALIILAVGVFAFFVTIQNIPITNTETEELIQEIADNGNSVFNVLGVVLVIGAIMTIVGLVYSFVAPSSGYDNDDDDDVDDLVYSNLHSKIFTEPETIKVKSKSKIKKKDSFEWGN